MASAGVREQKKYTDALMFIALCSLLASLSPPTATFGARTPRGLRKIALHQAARAAETIVSTNQVLAKVYAGTTAPKDCTECAAANLADSRFCPTLVRAVTARCVLYAARSYIDLTGTRRRGAWRLLAVMVAVACVVPTMLLAPLPRSLAGLQAWEAAAWQLVRQRVNSFRA